MSAPAQAIAVVQALETVLRHDRGRLMAALTHRLGSFQRAEDALAERGAGFLYLPKYSPDPNPIEMAFSKLKAHLRAAAARTFEDLNDAIGDICKLFTPAECWNFLKAAGYAST